MRTKVLGSLVVILAIFASSAVIAQTSAKPVTLTFWAGSAYYNSDEAKKPQSEWAITKIIGDFEAQNPNVKVDMTPIEVSSESLAKFKAAAIAKNGPDVIELWTGSYLFPLKDILLPLNAYIPAADKKNISGWDAVTYNFKPNGEILGYPIGNNYAGLVYNKALVKAAGMDWDKNPPKTTEDFRAALKKIKQTGVIPFGFDASKGRIMHYATIYWWVEESGYERLVSDSEGRTKFVDDKGFLNLMTYMQSLYSDGLTNSDAATSVDYESKFSTGKYAVTVGGVNNAKAFESALGPENFGFLPFPSMSSSPKVKASIIGGPGNCLAVGNYTKNRDLAVKFISFLCSKPAFIQLTKSVTTFPSRTDVTLDDLGWTNDPFRQKIYALSKNFAFWIDNSIPEYLYSEMKRFFPNIVVGKLSPRDFAAQMDKLVQSNK
ncbi:MAG TPA: extracellular solute-binding protein [Rectinemataceae bacterium]|nr:extracellular solute-binding protein [Rectinemataceae bacterium]